MTDEPARETDQHARAEVVLLRAALAAILREQEVTEPYVGPARDGIEAQYGLNDTWPGDPYP